MKNAQKLITLVVMLAMVMALMTTAFAAEGSITITNAAIGKEYQAYKIFDATYNDSAVSYTTKNPAMFNDSPWTVSSVADANGNHSVQLADGKTIEDISTWITTNYSNFQAINPTSGVEDDNKTAKDYNVIWSGLEYGYYYITSTLGTFVTIDNVTPSASVVDKNLTAPSNLEKVSDSATAQIGDEVNFTITFTATNYITTNTKAADGKVTANTTQVTKYTITDTMDGFDYKNNSLVVKVGGTTLEGITPTINAGTLTINIDWVENNALKYNHEENVVVTYIGVVNKDADDGNATNAVVVSNNTNTSVLTASTTTNTYSLTINKTDGSEPLKGAKFELYRNEETTALQLIDITSEITNAEQGTKYYRVARTDESGTATIDMSEAISAIIYGLDGADTYKIKEIEAPAGYNKLDSTTDHAMNNNNGTEEIVNKSGSLLPSTGGIGTTIFYALGGVMVLAALVFLVTNKRMRAE